MTKFPTLVALAFVIAAMPGQAAQSQPSQVSQAAAAASGDWHMGKLSDADAIAAHRKAFFARIEARAKAEEAEQAHSAR